MKTNQLRRRLAEGFFLSFTLLTLAPLARGQTFKLLHTFRGSNDIAPSTLVEGSDGNFYGTTGTCDGCGPVTDHGKTVRMTRDGVITTLVRFNGTNGTYPTG